MLISKVRCDQFTCFTGTTVQILTRQAREQVGVLKQELELQGVGWGAREERAGRLCEEVLR
jgi:hypothetical protein